MMSKLESQAKEFNNKWQEVESQRDLEEESYITKAACKGG